MIKLAWTIVALIALTLVSGCQSAVAPMPFNAAYDIAGPPTVGDRMEIGEDCLLPLVLPWAVTGDIEGSMEVDYDILIHGPCDPDGFPGKYDESWVFNSNFEGTVGGREGTFETFAVADITDGHLTGQMAIVPGSGTGELVGLRGVINVDEMMDDEAPWPLTGYYYYESEE